MKIHSLLVLCFAAFFFSCSKEKKEPHAVLASRSVDSVKVEWLKPHEAVLHIRLDGEYPRALLTDLRISISGREDHEIQDHADQLLTHPFEKEYAVAPEEEQTEISISAVVGGKECFARTIVPHLFLDTRTQLNLNLSGDRLRMVSCWIEEFVGDLQEQNAAVDTVQVGCYLDDRGDITSDYQPSSVAIVFETDGFHGKAVALSDAQGEWVFSSGGSSSGFIFESLDGVAREGVLNRRRHDADSLGILFYNASLPYTSDCAFSNVDGFDLCWRLKSADENTVLQDRDMLGIALLRDGSYVPSAAEMALLYNTIHGYNGEMLLRKGFHVPQGSYLTSSESSENSVYSMDFTQGALTAFASKRFSPLRVRLFYIF